MKYAAIIVETRTGEKYVDVIKQHMKHLPTNWDLVIVTNEDNFAYYHQRFSNAYLYACPKIKDANDYNRLLTTSDFWKQFEYYEKVLIFQHDSMILRNNIEEFLKYDYIGSPWTFQDSGANGGLSLRNPKVMTIICTTFPYNTTLGNEDLYFSNIMNKYYIGYLADRSSCTKFAMEVIYQENTFGVHAIDRYHDEETCKKIIAQEE